MQVSSATPPHPLLPNNPLKLSSTEAQNPGELQINYQILAGEAISIISSGIYVIPEDMRLRSPKFLIQYTTVDSVITHLCGNP